MGINWDDHEPDRKSEQPPMTPPPKGEGGKDIWDMVQEFINAPIVDLPPAPPRPPKPMAVPPDSLASDLLLRSLRLKVQKLELTVDNLKRDCNDLWEWRAEQERIARELFRDADYKKPRKPAWWQRWFPGLDR